MHRKRQRTALWTHCGQDQLLIIWSSVRCALTKYVNKNMLFSALPLENLLLGVICYLLFKFKLLQCGLLVWLVVCYVQRAVQTE